MVYIYIYWTLEDRIFSDDFRGNRSYLVRLNFPDNTETAGISTWDLINIWGLGRLIDRLQILLLILSEFEQIN